VLMCACVSNGGWKGDVEMRRRPRGREGAVAKKSSGGQPFVTGRQIVIRQDKPAEIRVSDNEK